MLELVQLAAALADTLDELAAAILLLDANAIILHANATARAMLSDGDLLQAAANGKLCCAALAKALRDVLTAANTDTPTPASTGAAVGLLTREGQPFVATIIPLSHGIRQNAHHSAVAAVFVRKAEIDLLMPLEAVANLYKLSRGETRVLSAIVNGHGVPEAACLLGLSEATIRTHLKHVFYKTGTTRQAELIKLVAGFRAPRLVHCETKH